MVNQTILDNIKLAYQASCKCLKKFGYKAWIILRDIFAEKEWTKLALLFSAIWIFIAIIFFLFNRKEFLSNPNNLGDFLAGFFSPLAFLWLVLGYYQQQEEIKLLRKEIVVSSDHLKVQNQLLADKEDQLVRESLPVLDFLRNKYFDNIAIFNIANTGSKISRISVRVAARDIEEELPIESYFKCTLDNGHGTDLASKSNLNNNETGKLRIKYTEKEIINKKTFIEILQNKSKLSLTFLTNKNSKFTQEFQYSEAADRFKPTAVPEPFDQ